MTEIYPDTTMGQPPARPLADRVHAQPPIRIGQPAGNRDQLLEERNTLASRGQLLKQQLDARTAEIEGLRAQLHTAQQQHQRHEREISQLTAQNTAFGEALRDVESEIARYRTERDEWHKLATDATRQREELREQLGEAARQRDEARDKLARALAANQRWAETLGDIQQAGRDSTPAQEPGEWGILELMGHRTAIGRISERELAGKPMLHVQRVDGITQWYSPDSLYALTPCTAEQAAEAARKQYQPGLPYGLRAITAASDDDEDDADPWHSDGGDRVAATPDGTPYPVERDGETF